MADKKISQLTAASTPLAGTEVAPVVQGGATVKATVDSFTSGRAITPLSITQNGKSVPYSLFNSGIPMVLPSSGTMGNNGALSGIAAVSAIYPHAYVYMPANAISAGSAAGYYYAQFSSVTAATLYNNTYSAGAPPSVPSSPTPFVTTGPGAYTQSTATETVAISIPLAANLMGVSSSIDLDLAAFFTNNANSKIIRVAIDSTANLICNLTAIGTSFVRMRPSFVAMGVTNRQISAVSLTPAAGNVGSSTMSAGQGGVLSLDMTSPHNLIVYLRNLNAADTSVLVTAQASVTY